MTLLIILASAGAVLTALLITKVGVRISFGESFRLWLVIGLIKKEINLNGGKKEKPKPESTPESKSEIKAEDSPESEKKDIEEPNDEKGTFLDRFDKKKLIKFGFRAIKGVFKLPRVDILEFSYIAGGTEADKTAVTYGRMCAALGAAIPFINNHLRVKNWSISTDLDFSRQKPFYAGRVQVTVTIGAVIAFTLWALVELLKCMARNPLPRTAQHPHPQGKDKKKSN